MVVETLPYDTADYIRTPEQAAAYLEVTIEENPHDVGAIANALGTIARAQGMTALAEKTGLTREGLYKTLSADGKPSFESVLKITKALGLKLHVTAA